MGISAAIAASAGASAMSARKAEKAQKKEQKRLAKIEAENKRKEDASTPFASNDAAKRIGLERAYLRRSAGKGRTGTTIRRSSSLG